MANPLPHTRFASAASVTPGPEARRSTLWPDDGHPGVAAALDLLPRVTELRVLHLNDSGLTTVPESFAALTRLETLSLFQNQLTDLPDAIATLPALRSLVVGKNAGTRQIKARPSRQGVSYVVS